MDPIEEPKPNSGDILHRPPSMLNEVLRDRAMPFYALVLLCAAIAMIAVLGRASIDQREALKNYRSESHAWTQRSKSIVEMRFMQVYQGLRTLARLPGVRKIDRLGKQFDNDAHQSAQEIYNNLALNVDVSEVYIVPVGFDPDQVNATTGKLSEPIIQFDARITRRPEVLAYPQASRLDVLAKPSSEVDENSDEVEIFEYRVMREQMQRFADLAPDETKLKRLSYPSIASREVITCDNTHFDPRHPDDRRRTGIVFSVPFYGTNGQLRGMVSAVIRSDVLGAMIDGHQALRSTGYDIVVPAARFHPAPAEAGFIRKGQTVPEQLYSETVPLNLPDTFGRWILWSSRSDDDFWARRDVAASIAIAALGSVGVIAAALLLLACVRLQHSISRAAHEKNRELETRVKERTASLERATLAAETANRAKSAFLASMSHELRTPLNAIIGFSSLIAEELHGPIADQRYVGYAKDVKSGGDHLLSIINDILELSKVEAGKLELQVEPVPIAHVIEDAIVYVSGAADKAGIRLDGTRPDANLELQLDRRKITQVLINLLANAIKFTPSGGTVSVLLDLQAQDGCTISVTDTGIGMSEEQIPIALAPFGQIETAYTRTHQGTGLGLPLSKRFVEAMGGRLMLTSRPNSGTRVDLHFPQSCVITGVARAVASSGRQSGSAA